MLEESLDARRGAGLLLLLLELEVCNIAISYVCHGYGCGLQAGLLTRIDGWGKGGEEWWSLAFGGGFGLGG